MAEDPDVQLKDAVMEEEVAPVSVLNMVEVPDVQ